LTSNTDSSASIGSNKKLEGNNLLTKLLTACGMGWALAASVVAQPIANVDASPASAVPFAATPASAATGVSAASSQEANASHAGYLKSIHGTVRIVRPSGEARTAKTGDSLTASDRVETDADSGASVVMRDGTMMVVGPMSQLDLLQFSFDTTTHDGNVFVKLLRGSMRMVTGLIGKKNPEAIRVDTQTATIGIRGTDFIVTADGPR
jgi:hypothetical protein